MKTDANVHTWLIEPLSPEVKKSIRHLSQLKDVTHVAVMPDVHLGNDVCIGAVVASPARLYPQAVGNDIGCGMASVRISTKGYDKLTREDGARILERFNTSIPAVIDSQRGKEANVPNDLTTQIENCSALTSRQRRDAFAQLGTLGRGNHFLEIQQCDDGEYWLSVHSGSRALGQNVAQHHIALADKEKLGFVSFDAQSKQGREYFTDMTMALRYATENRTIILKKAESALNELLGWTVDRDTGIECCHNHVRLETHRNQQLWVHRKGANSAREGESGIISGSMGTPSFHTVGRGNSASLCSSSHGAGRSMSRTEARASISCKALAQQLNSVHFSESQLARLVDEAPQAYKDINKVMRAQKVLVKRVRKLFPALNFKVG